MAIRSRILDTPWTASFKNNGVTQPGYPKSMRKPYEVQLIYSSGHAFQYLGRTKGDIGGSFISQKLEVTLDGLAKEQWIRRPSTTTGIPWAQEYYNIPVPSTDITTMLSLVQSKAAGTRTAFIEHMDKVVPLGFSNSELSALGAKAVDVMAPNQPVADAMTTLAEFLSERKFFSVPGKAGSAPGEYLNYQFGVAPTVGFAQDLRKAIAEQEQIIDRLARNSGRLTRRRGDIYKPDKTIFSSQVSGVYPGFLDGFPVTNVMQPGTLTITTQVEKLAWFSGAFTYYLPEEGIMRRMAELDAVYGVKPGLDTAWELLPFSWLADYKISAGAALKNMSKFSSDGLVMPYGYIMGKSVTTQEYVWEGNLRSEAGDFRRVRLVALVTKTTKQRQQANPFGFGVLPGDLSNRQLSILAALGLTFLK